MIQYYVAKRHFSSTALFLLLSRDDFLPFSRRYPEYNLTYRPGVRIQHLWPSYIPFLESQSEQKYFIYLVLEGAQMAPGTVQVAQC